MAYKVTYFNITALGEPIRMLLSYGNIDFEDNRIESEDWPKLKSSTPLGQLPLLEVDGKKLHQSLAICRFLAKKVGLDGNDELENYEIDSVVDTFNELRQKIATVAYEQDAKLKEAKRKTLNEETIPFYLNKLEEIAKKNQGHLALKRTTWADLFFTGLNPYMNFIAEQDLTANYPNLKKVLDQTAAIESIKKWIAKRPKTDK